MFLHRFFLYAKRQLQAASRSDAFGAFSSRFAVGERTERARARLVKSSNLVQSVVSYYISAMRCLPERQNKEGKDTAFIASQISLSLFFHLLLLFLRFILRARTRARARQRLVNIFPIEAFRRVTFVFARRCRVFLVTRRATRPSLSFGKDFFRVVERISNPNARIRVREDTFLYMYVQPRICI